MHPTKRIALVFFLAALISIGLSACGPNNTTPSVITVGCSVADLIQAINDANANPDPTEIQLGYCQYTLTQPEDNWGIDGVTVYNGLPAIRTEIIIEGNSAMIEIQKAPGEPDFGHFFISGSGDLQLYDLLISDGVRPRGGAIVNKGGKFFASNVTFLNNSAYPYDFGGTALGGAIYSEDGGEVRIIAGTLFQDNRAGHYGTQNPSHGGAVYLRDSSFLIYNSSFLANLAAGRGGAVYSEKSPSFEGGLPVTMHNTDFRESIARLDGGAVALINEAEESLIADCHFSQNSADNHGGVIYSEDTRLSLDYSHILANQAVSGGAVFTKRTGVGKESQLYAEQTDFENNAASTSGGAIVSENSDVTLKESFFSGNEAFQCGTIQLGGEAGAVPSAGYLPTVPQIHSESEIKLSHFVHSQAIAGDGGALCHLMGELQIKDSSFMDNHSTGYGGAIISMDELEISQSHITSNSAIHGGGLVIGLPLDPQVYASPTFLNFQSQITGSWIRSNYAQENGGGIWAHHGGSLSISKSTLASNTAYSNGGAVYQDEGDLFIYNSTLAENTAWRGGGVYNRGESTTNPLLYLDHTTVAYNAATDTGGSLRSGGGGLNMNGEVSLTNSLVVHNNNEDCDLNQGMAGSYSPTGNLDTDGTCGFSSTNPAPQVDLFNGVLVRILPGSPLIDMLPACGRPDDQLGLARPQGSGCEPGSVEFDPNGPPLPPRPTEQEAQPEETESSCDPFGDLEPRLFTLGVDAETLVFPVYLRLNQDLPDAADDGSTPFTASLGDLEAYRCDTQGFPNRLYCLFRLGPGDPGTLQNLNFYQEGCGEPVFSQPLLSIPETGAGDGGQPDQDEATCSASLDQDACEASGGAWLDLDDPYCLCP